MSDNQTTADSASLLRHFAQFQGPPVDNAMMAVANEIDRLRAGMDHLVGLDVTTREGQAAFALWRNRHQSEKRQLSQRSMEQE